MPDTFKRMFGGPRALERGSGMEENNQEIEYPPHQAANDDHHRAQRGN